MKKLLAPILFALALFAVPAGAVDIVKNPPFPTKVAPFVLPQASCDAKGCTGWHVDFSVLNAGTGVNVLSLGSVNSNGTFLGLGGGYQYYDGKYWLGARVTGAYNVAGNGNVADPGNWFGSEVVEVGGNLFGAFGLQPPQTNGFLSTLTTAVPTVDVGACQHGKATGYCAGASLHYLLPSTPIELTLGYLNAQYGNTQLAPGQTMAVDNLVTFSAKYHF